MLFSLHVSQESHQQLDHNGANTDSRSDHARWQRERYLCHLYTNAPPKSKGIGSTWISSTIDLTVIQWYMIYMIPPPELLQNVCIGSTLQILQGITRIPSSEHLLLYAKVLPAPVLQSLEMACYHWPRVSDRRRVPSGLRQQQYPGCSVSPIHPKQTQQVDRYFHNPQQQKIISFRV